MRQGRAVLLSARPTGEGGCIQAVPEAVPAHPGRNQARAVASGGVRARGGARIIWEGMRITLYEKA